MVTKAGKIIRGVGGFVGIGTKGIGVAGVQEATNKANFQTAVSTGQAQAQAGVTAVQTTGGIVYVPSPSAPNGGGGGGGGSGGGGSNGGFSYVDKLGVGYEVSPEGIKKEVKVDRGSSTRQQLNKLGRSETNRYGGNSQRETYRPELRGYTTPESFSRGGTTVVRQPTYEEAIRIQERENELNRNIATVNLGKLASDIKDVRRDEQLLSSTETEFKNKEAIVNEFVKGKIDEGGYFVGTPEEYEKYQGMFKEYSDLGTRRERAYEDYSSKSTIKTGIGTGRLSRDVSISKFDFSTRPVTSTLNVFGSSAGSVLGGVGESLGKEGGYFSDKARNVTVYTPQKGTVQSGITGYSQLEIPSTSFGTPTQLRKVGEVTGDIGVPLLAYASPIGTGLLAGQSVEVGADIYRTKKATGNIPTSLLVEGAFLGGALVTGGVIKGGSIIKNNAIRNAITRDIKTLEKTPIGSLTFIDEGSGIVSATGFRRVGTTTQDIKYTGRIMKTEKGFEFVPTGVGGNVVRGTVTPKILGMKLKPKQYVSGTEFELGGKGTNIFLKNIGEAKMYEEVGYSTSIPKKDYFGITTIDKGALTKQNIKELRSQLKTSRTPENVVYKNLQLPIGQRNILFKLNENVALRVNPQEVGTVIKIPKKTDVETFGFQGGGQKSSSEFMQGLYSQELKLEEQVKLLPKVGDVKTTPNILLPKTSIKPVASPYQILSAEERTTGINANVRITDMPSETINLNSKVLVNQKDIVGTLVNNTTKVKNINKPSARFSSIPTLDIVSKVKQDEKITQKFSQAPQLRLKLLQKEQQRQKFNQMQMTKTIVKPKLEPKIKFMPVIIPTSNKILDRVKSGESGLFEAIGFRFGKEVSLLKGTKEESAKSLGEFLKGTLGASGYLKKTSGEKIKAEETGLLGNFGYRKSKTGNKFLVVEEKGMRLRKGTTGKTIQTFRF